MQSEITFTGQRRPSSCGGGGSASCPAKQQPNMGVEKNVFKFKKNVLSDPENFRDFLNDQTNSLSANDQVKKLKQKN